jgi:cytochrome c oxidase cbb3-type subunit 3
MTHAPAAIVNLTCAASLLVAVSACRPHDGPAAGSGTPPAEGPSASVPLGDLAGAATYDRRDPIVDRWDGNAAAIARGHDLFISMNCAGCHGYDAAGNMGPNLTDHYWRYGGTPASVYKSIYEGRPQGMPAWGSALPRAEIWKIVAYLQSLGGMVAATDYQGGLQGDHDVSSVAPGIGAIGAANGVPVPADNAAAPDVPASAPVPTT